MKDRLRLIFESVILAVALMGFWIACVGNHMLHDLLLGAVAVILSLAFSVFVVRTLPLHFRPTLYQISQIRHLPWDVIVDLGQIVVALAVDFAGDRCGSYFRSSPWHRISDDGGEVAARTLAIAYTTVSPNMVVVGIDHDRHQMLFHQLRKSDIPQMTINLGAEDVR